MTNTDYLFHYTSIETLALILENRTLRFNNLLYVDDVEEAETEDMGLFGKMIFVSCWTDLEEEQIPLWNLYTPNMQGVRIRFPKYPFVKYHYSKGDYNFKEDADSYIDYSDKRMYEKCSIVPNLPHLIQIEYTDDIQKLKPVVRHESYIGAAKDFINCESLEDVGDKQPEVRYCFDDLGKYKNTSWSFQREWRYWISVSPMGISEMSPPSLRIQQEQIRRLEDRSSPPPVRDLFLRLCPEVFNDMEIVFGPKMSAAQKIMVRALVEKYAPKAVCRDSRLKIRE